MIFIYFILGEFLQLVWRDGAFYLIGCEFRVQIVFDFSQHMVLLQYDLHVGECFADLLY